MTQPVEPTGYATVEDYEIRTGTQVPDEQHDLVQVRLNDNSTLIALYLGECEEAVATAYPDLLTSIACEMTAATIGRQYGAGGAVASTSVGSTSVTYATPNQDVGWLPPQVTDILDRLMLSACGEPVDVSGVGELGVGHGGGPVEEPYDQLWVIAGPPRRQP